MLKASLQFFERQFGKASLMAKLSLIFNLALAYTITVLHNNEGALTAELIKCHASKYTDFNDLMVRMNLLKAKVTDEAPTAEIKKDIEEITKLQKQTFTNGN